MKVYSITVRVPEDVSAAEAAARIERVAREVMERSHTIVGLSVDEEMSLADSGEAMRAE